MMNVLVRKKGLGWTFTWSNEARFKLVQAAHLQTNFFSSGLYCSIHFFHSTHLIAGWVYKSWYQCVCVSVCGLAAKFQQKSTYTSITIRIKQKGQALTLIPHKIYLCPSGLSVCLRTRLDIFRNTTHLHLWDLYEMNIQNNASVEGQSMHLNS